MVRFNPAPRVFYFLQARIFSVFLGLAGLALPMAVSKAEPGACIPLEWAISVVDPNVLDIDSYVTDMAIFLEQGSQPRIFYAKGPLEGNAWRIRSAVQRSDTWRVQKLPADPGSPEPAVAVDHRGTYHLAWRTGVFFGEGILRYTKIERGVWGEEEIVDDAQGATSHISIAVDENGNPHIVYTPELAGLPMRYASWNGTEWEKEDIVVRGGILSPSLALDAAGEPRVAYIVDGGGELDYAFRSLGTWTIEAVDNVSPNQTLEASLVLDSRGRPRIAYDELFAVGIHYAARSEAGWSIELVDVGQRWKPALVLDPDDRPHMVFYGAEEGAMIYATRTSGSWCVQTIEDDPSPVIRIGRNGAIALDDLGAIHVAYHYHDAFDVCQVKYAVAQRSAW
jgi:hypothetical protein